MRATVRLLSALFLLATSARGSHAQSTARASLYRFAGFVSDSVGSAVAYADIQVTATGGEPHSVKTDAHGHFSLDAVAGGIAKMTVRRMGYHPYSGTIRIGGDDGVDSVHAVLYAASLALAGVEVREMATDDSSWPAEFRARKRSSQFGYFLDRAKLEATHASRPSDALRGVPGVTLLPSRRIGNLVRLRGCRPTLWIDGTRAAGAELDELVTVTDLEAVEVYSSIAGLPPRYLDRQNVCGAVLIWTRIQ